MEYDEASGEWKRRYGYKRANDESDVPVIEAKAGDQVRRPLRWGRSVGGSGAGAWAQLLCACSTQPSHTCRAPPTHPTAPHNMVLQPGEDPFTKMRQDKRERVKKQQAQQLGNLKAAAKAGGAGALPPTLRLASTLPDHGKGRPVKRKEMKGEVGAGLGQAQLSRRGRVLVPVAAPMPIISRKPCLLLPAAQGGHAAGHSVHSLHGQV